MSQHQFHTDSRILIKGKFCSFILFPYKNIMYYGYHTHEFRLGFLWRSWDCSKKAPKYLGFGTPIAAIGGPQNYPQTGGGVRRALWFLTEGCMRGLQTERSKASSSVPETTQRPQRRSQLDPKVEISQIVMLIGWIPKTTMFSSVFM